MKNEIITTEQENTIIAAPVFSDKRLNAATKKITKYANSIRTNYYGIAKCLAEVADNKYFEADGFKNAAEYAETTFGIKRAQAYNLIRIGRDYTTPELTSNLPHDGNDYTTTQVLKMLPIGDREEVIEFVEAEQITPDMTAAEINKKVKAYLKKDEPVEDSVAEDDGETAEPAEDIKSAIKQIKNILMDYAAEDIDIIITEVAAWVANRQ